MTGVPGRSGKVSTAESRKLRRDAAIKGGLAAAGRATDGVKSDPPEGMPAHSQALLAAFPELSGYPFPVEDSLALKDALEAALKQAKARQAEVELEEANTKLDLARNRLIERAELDRAIAAVRDAWWREAQQISGMVLPKLADLAGDTRARVKAAIDAEVLAAAERVKKALTA